MTKIIQHVIQFSAKKADPEPTVNFTTSLGCAQTITIRFTNFSKQKTEYSAILKSEEFFVEKSITAIQAPSISGNEISFETTYEPTKIGRERTELILSSPVGGEYVIPLIASCSQPKPQGPFTIKHKSQTSISFKNVFSEPTEFILSTDCSCFTVSKKSEVLKAKKVSHRIFLLLL